MFNLCFCALYRFFLFMKFVMNLCTQHFWWVNPMFLRVISNSSSYNYFLVCLSMGPCFVHACLCWCACPVFLLIGFLACTTPFCMLNLPHYLVEFYLGIVRMWSFMHICIFVHEFVCSLRIMSGSPYFSVHLHVRVWQLLRHFCIFFNKQ